MSPHAVSTTTESRKDARVAGVAGASRGNCGARVAILVPNDLTKKEGTSVRALGVIPVVARSFRTTVLTGRDPKRRDQEAWGDATVERFFDGSRRSLSNPFDLLVVNLLLVRALLRGRFDAVYAEGPYATLLLPSLFLASRLGGPRFIYEAHAVAYLERRQVSKLQPLLLYPLELLVGSLASGVVALSGEAYRFYSKFSRRAFFIPVFVEPGAGRPERHAVPNRMKTVGLVGPFDEVFNRGQLEFLLANLDEFDDRIVFVLIGKLSKRLDGKRLWARGFLSDEEYPREVAALDGLLVPATVATYGPKNKIVEAMAWGVPVFTSPEGVVGLDHARPGENIFVFALDRMVQELNSLIFDEERLARVSANARRTVEDHYAAGELGERVPAAISEVLA